MSKLKLRVMESSNNYNNHFVRITKGDKNIFDKCLIGFNNTELASELEELVTNKKLESIKALDVYGYSGEIQDSSIIPKLIKYNEKNKLT